MRIKFAAAATLFAVGLASAAFAQPAKYNDDYSNSSDGLYQTPVAPAKPVHYPTHVTPPAYSSDYTNDSDGFAPVAMGKPAKVDTTATASIKPLPACHSMVGPKGSRQKGADSGASRTEACREMH